MIAPLSISAWNTVFTVRMKFSWFEQKKKKKKEKRAGLLKAVFDAIVSIRLELDNEYSHTVYMY